MDESIAKIVKNYRTKINDNSIYFTPHIPQKKLLSVLNSYAEEAKKENPFVLIDNTVFGGAKDGAILTDKGIYAHNYTEKTIQKFRLMECSRVTLIEFRKSNFALYLNGEHFLDVSQPRLESMQQFTKMLQEIITSINPLSSVKNRIKENLAEKESGTEMRDIQQLRRKGVTAVEFWQFILSSFSRQKVWIESSKTNQFDVPVWRFLLEAEEFQEYILEWKVQEGVIDGSQIHWSDILEQEVEDLFFESLFLFSQVPIKNREQKILNLLRTELPQNNLFVAPNIPIKKIENVQQGCKIPISERILGIMDCTHFGSAKTAIVFTQSHIYCQRVIQGQKPSTIILYEELLKYELEELADSILLNPHQIINVRGHYPNDRLYRLFRTIRHYQIDQKLFKYATDPIDALLKLLKEDSIILQKVVIWTLMELKATQEKVIEKLMEFMANKNEEVVRLAIRALIELAQEEQIREIVSKMAKAKKKASDNLIFFEILQQISCSQEVLNIFEQIREEFNFGFAEVEIMNLSETSLRFMLEPYGLEVTIPAKKTYIFFLSESGLNIKPKAYLQIQNSENVMALPTNFVLDFYNIYWEENENYWSCFSEEIKVYEKQTGQLMIES